MFFEGINGQEQNILNELILFLSEWKESPVMVMAVGSALNGYWTKESDIDIRISFCRSSSWALSFKLQRDLGEFLGKKGKVRSIASIVENEQGRLVAQGANGMLIVPDSYSRPIAVYDADYTRLCLVRFVLEPGGERRALDIFFPGPGMLTSEYLLHREVDKKTRHLVLYHGVHK